MTWVILATIVGSAALGFYWHSRQAMSPDEREQEDAEMQSWQP